MNVGFGASKTPRLGLDGAVFREASLVAFKVNPRLRLGLTLNSTRLALLEESP